MLIRIKKKKNSFANKLHAFKENSPRVKFVREKLQSKKCVTIYLIADREYTYKISGRCTSFRSRRNMSSFVIRNFSYGVEQRVFINNPRLDICV